MNIGLTPIQLREIIQQISETGIVSSAGFQSLKSLWQKHDEQVLK